MAQQKNKVLGVCACPICKYPAQEVRESTKGKPYISCDECGVQIFARQPASVKLINGMMRASAPEKPEPIKPVAQAAPPVVKPAPEPKAEPKPEPKEERTIFDIFRT